MTKSQVYIDCESPKTQHSRKQTPKKHSPGETNHCSVQWGPPFLVGMPQISPTTSPNATLILVPSTICYTTFCSQASAPCLTCCSRFCFLPHAVCPICFLCFASGPICHQAVHPCHPLHPNSYMTSTAYPCHRLFPPPPPV